MIIERSFLEIMTLRKWHYQSLRSCLVKVVFFYFFLLIFFFLTFSAKKIYYIFSLFSLCQVELFHPNFTAQAHMSLLSSFCIFF